MKDTLQCSKDYMEFTYHNDILTHKCSGKKVCPQGMLFVGIFECFILRAAKFALYISVLARGLSFQLVKRLDICYTGKPNVNTINFFRCQS